MTLGLNWDLNDAVDPEFGARFADALASEGLLGLRDVLTDEVNWHVTGAGPLSGTYQGTAAVIELLTGMRAQGIRFLPFDTLVSDAHCGLLLVYERDTPGGKQSAYGMWLMHVDDGKAGECFWYVEDPEAFARLLAGI